MSDPQDELLTCPKCNSDWIAVTAEQMWLVNTNEHWCHSVKTQDSDAKATCLDCAWVGQRQQLNTQPKPSKARKGRK
jgi:transcription elongation factor Elf1